VQAAAARLSGELPRTGSTTAPIVVAGAALLLVGAGALFASSRRAGLRRSSARF
jgi:LPXTG-motif cell wall-anchored protein